MSDTPDILAGLDMTAPPPTAEEHAAFRARQAAKRAEEGKPATCTRCLRRIATRAEYQATEGHALRCECDECGPRCFAPFGLTVVCEELRRDRLAKLRTVEEQARDATLADARCLPPGLLAAVAAVLREGAAAKGCAPHESGGGQTMAEHLEHAFDHVGGARSVEQCHGAAEVDPDDLTHAIARLALVWSLR